MAGITDVPVDVEERLEDLNRRAATRLDSGP
jgi:hypothetical protein